MEKNSVINIDTIENLHIPLRDKNILCFDYMGKDGAKHSAVLTIPENPENNKVYKGIINKFGEDVVTKLQRAREDLIKHAQIQDEIKKEALEQARSMSDLFKQKEQAFNQFWINESNDDIKLAIRCAPNIQTVAVLLTAEYINYINKNNLTHLDMVDKQEEYMYE